MMQAFIRHCPVIQRASFDLHDSQHSTTAQQHSHKMISLHLPFVDGEKHDDVVPYARACARTIDLWIINDISTELTIPLDKHEAFKVWDLWTTTSLLSPRSPQLPNSVRPATRKRDVIDARYVRGDRQCIEGGCSPWEWSACVGHPESGAGVPAM